MVDACLRWSAMSRRDENRSILRALDRADWEPYLRQQSGLPGPRGNLELAEAAADEGDQATFEALLATGDEYLTVCALIGLGRLMTEGMELEDGLHRYAADARWRVREGVAMALQRLGDADID